jgi:hypothetical protein
MRSRMFGPLAAGTSLLLLASFAAAELPADPWALVPAPPTSCYQSQDSFAGSINDVVDGLQQAIDEQEAANQNLTGQISSAAEQDPFALARNFQQFAAKDPQAAIAMMQKLQASSATIQASVQKDAAEDPQRQAALDKLIADYRTASQAVYSTMQAKVQKLPTVKGEGGDAIAPAAVGQLRAIGQETNAAYEQLCAKWFRQGPFKPWLDEYRGHLTSERTPRDDDIVEQQKQQLAVQGIDTAEFRSTGAATAARDYAKALAKIYRERPEQPLDVERLYGVTN